MLTHRVIPCLDTRDGRIVKGVKFQGLRDAGYGVGHEVPRDRAGVILGRGGYLTPGMARLADRVRTPQQLITTLAELVPGLDAETLARIRAAFLARRDDLGPDTAIGLVPNLAASRIANRLDLRGPAYTVDAACASSLLATAAAASSGLTSTSVTARPAWAATWAMPCPIWPPPTTPRLWIADAGLTGAPPASRCPRRRRCTATRRRAWRRSAPAATAA